MIALTKLDLYLDSLRGKKILVLGLGISNRPLARLLASHSLDVTGCDKLETPDEELKALEKAGVKLKLGKDYLENLTGDVVFRTPGMRPDLPAIAALTAHGARLTSEMEAFFEVCPCKILAVTGSDGKTTTTTLIAELLKRAGRRVWVGGNIGHPLLGQVPEMRAEDCAVLELSSFQLMTMQKSPHIAVVTNLAPNHLDIHKDMAEYVAAKKNIFLHQRPDDVLIVNADNAYTAAFAAEARGHVCTFSATGEADVYYRDGAIYRRGGKKIVSRSAIKLPGMHNVENYMTAIAATAGLVTDASIAALAAEFGGVEHRIELVRVRNGVSYYNDSIASSPTRTIAGLRSFPNKIILIAGGYDKHIPYDVLG
ncbi:MAG: UDP-N-acetylmuramoyl-L-alanine--D-glutamate ligase, partial [Oscillospiraceae bacterium]|nr:UDP-N-acetylmuramoyl-L-alanine--D-glutamate ligase [Oscillospiraceae bacterium]